MNRKNVAIFSWVFLVVLISIIIFIFPSSFNGQWDLESYRAGFLTPLVLLIPALTTAYKRDRRFNLGDNK